MFTSLIYTAELNKVMPFGYLVALLEHADQVRMNPSAWMPWTYQSALRQLNAGQDQPESTSPS